MKIMMYPETISKAGPIFLGGSTAKGDWQREVINRLADTTATVINTSRPDWDVKAPTPFAVVDHIEWEMDWLNRAPIVFIYIPKDAKSPTVLLELGIAITRYPNLKTVVCIEEGYSHFNNAVCACHAARIHPFINFDDAVKRLKDLYLTSGLI